MSLAVLADHMASKGRGGDSMLIHMAPQEIAGLQALAVANGSSLTTNPDTGLPEALSLKKLLPAIIGFGLNYFVPGLGSAVGSALGTSAAVGTGVAVGGFEALRTGDLGKGISAGLGAYGGAGLSEGLMTAGSTEAGLSSAALNAELAQAQGLPEGLSSGDAFNKFLTSDANPAVSEALKNATPFERMTAGLDTAKAAPGAFLKDNFKYLAAGAAPVLADQAVKSNLPTTTTRPGMITPYSFFGGQYVAGNPYQATPTKSAEGGLMGLAAGGIAGYGDGDDVPRQNGMAQGGMYDFAQRSEPVVRMAEGGVPGYAGNDGSLVGGYKPSDTEIFNYFKTPGLTDAKIAQDMQTFGVSAADIARVTGTQGQQGDYEKRFVNTLIAPGTDASEFQKATSAVGLQNQALATAMQNAGLSQGAQYALTQPAQNDVGFTGGVIDSKTGKAVDLYNQLGYTAGKLPGDQGGLEGLYGNINYVSSGLQNLIDTGKMSVADAQNAALAELARTGVSVADVKGATGKDFGNLFTAKKPDAPVCGFGMQLNKAGTACEQIICGTGFQLNKAGTACEAIVTTKDTIVGGTGNDTIVTKGCPTGFHKSADGLSCVPNAPVLIDWKDCGTGYHWDKAQQACVVNTSVTQNTTDTVDTSTSLITAPATTLPVGVGGTTGPSIEGGGATINPNGTITVSPVIPGIPAGGFTGMTNLRDVYEKGGGSLGVNKNIFTPKTYKELEDRFKLTGGSKQSMDYLTGKTKYSPTPFTEDGQIAKSYAESVMKLPSAASSKMYIFKNGRYEVNPDYAIPTFDKDGKKSSNLTNADVKTFVDKGPSADAFYTWATTNNLSPEQIALASGKPINEISKLFTGAKDLVGEDGKIDQTKVDEKAEADLKANFDFAAYLKANPDVQAELDAGKANFGSKDDLAAAAWEHYQRYGKAQKRALKAEGGLAALTMARGGMGQQFNLGDYSDGGRLLRGPGDGVSDSIPATIGGKRPARLADGEFVVPARIVSELGNGSTEAGARKLYAMMDRIQSARRGTVGKGRVAKNSRAEKYLPA